MTDITKKFLAIPTTCISDAMQGLNNLDPLIKPLRESFKVAGRAYTVQMPVGDNLAILRAIRQAKPRDVLVIDAKGDTYRAVAGDFVLGMAQTLGIAGIVVDGAIRDVEDTKALDFPVFCKGTTVAASGKKGMGQVNVPISCGGVPVQPGDIIVGDVDGVVVIPQQIEEVILEKAMQKLAKDEQRGADISGNVEAIKRYLDDFLAGS